MNQVCGYMVLRKPCFNFDERGIGAFPKHVPEVGGKYYGGVDRMPWFDLHKDYYSEVLPKDLTCIRKGLLDEKSIEIDFFLERNLDAAVNILEYSNKSENLNELIAIHSKRLEKFVGNIECESEIIWLGIDIYYDGYGSQILQGYFEKPELFDNFSQNINENGLFDLEDPLIDQYIKEYMRLSHQYNLEPMDEAISYLDKIAVGRLTEYS